MKTGFKVSRFKVSRHSDERCNFWIYETSKLRNLETMKPDLLLQYRVVPIAHQLGPHTFSFLDVGEWSHLNVEELIR